MVNSDIFNSLDTAETKFILTYDIINLLDNIHI